MNKNFIAGEKMSAFVKRPAGASGAWVCPTMESAYKLQRALGASAYRAGLSVSCTTIPGVMNNEKAVFTVIATTTAAKPF